MHTNVSLDKVVRLKELTEGRYLNSFLQVHYQFFYFYSNRKMLANLGPFADSKKADTIVSKFVQDMQNPSNTSMTLDASVNDNEIYREIIQGNLLEKFKKILGMLAIGISIFRKYLITSLIESHELVEGKAIITQNCCAKEDNPIPFGPIEISPNMLTKPAKDTPYNLSDAIVKHLTKDPKCIKCGVSLVPLTFFNRFLETYKITNYSRESTSSVDSTYFNV